MINIWGLVLTIFLYFSVKKLKNIKFLRKIPPMVIAGIIIIILLQAFRIDYSNYNKSACFLTLLLGPATIALAYPLTQNIGMLSQNKRAVYFGFIVAVITAVVTNLILGNLFHTDISIVLSMMPKSVTTPIAIEISKTVGGIPELTACIVVITGVYGALFGHRILKICRIKSDTAIGLAMGATSHVLGTSSCVEKQRQKQIVMSTLALIIVGILTTIVSIVLL